MKIYPPTGAISLSTENGHVKEFGEYFYGLKTRWVHGPATAIARLTGQSAIHRGLIPLLDW